MQTMRFSGSLLPAVKELIQLHSRNQCTTFTSTELHNLLDKLVTIPDIAGRNKAMSQLLFTHANMYVKEGNLSQSMALLDRANKFVPGVSIPMYQAWLLASAGLYKEAIEYLDMAERADAKRSFLAPSRMDEISRLKQQYFQKLL
jgi:hypothetical protein